MPSQETILPGLAELERAADLVHETFETPQYAWPLLSARCGCEVWVKHENYTPTGAFKVRGGLLYMNELKKAEPKVKGVVAATTGNHGQSVAFAGTRAGLTVRIVVPKGNSADKNAAMLGFGAELLEHGRDFDEALPFARNYASERGLHFVESFHPWLVRGVATFSLELFRAVPDLDVLYVPVGLGSGICGANAARDALGLKAEIVGVVSEKADCYARSLAAGKAVETRSADTFAGGLAVRVPNKDALEVIRKRVARLVRVSEEALFVAIRHYFTDTHNLAEGAGAAGLAGLLSEREKMAGKKVGLILSGGNIDRAPYLRALQSP